MRRWAWLGVWLLAMAMGLGAQAAPAPNLRGEVMILVYHRFAATDARWTRAWDSFDRDLARLEAEGYRPVTLKQLVQADFVLPAGTTPVVLTFDDGTENQVKFTADGQVAPDCALGHWMAFAKTHPDFPVHGTWFVNAGVTPFVQKEFVQKKLALLVQLGSEIGNHTYTHLDLKKSTPEVVAKQIALGEWGIHQWLPNDPLFSFALPFGNFPSPEAPAFSGTWTGPPRPGAAPVTVSWKYGAVVKVGANPAASPLVAGFDPLHLPRVQAFDPEFGKWLDFFVQHPKLRFYSDGERHAPGSLAAAPKPAARGSR